MLPVFPQRFASTVERWFARHQRPLPWRRTYDPYQVWISEVMLQQTRMEVVLRYFDRFMERFPDLLALARASRDEVLTAWSGLGYYRRAALLHDGARRVVADFEGRIPSTVGELTSIPGIGRYTAGAIASIAHRQAVPIVDGNIARILSRVFGIEAATGSPELMRAAWSIAAQLVAAARWPRHFNQGLMELGALVCKPRNPACGRCPLHRICVAFASGRAEALPLLRKKRPVRRMTIPLYVIADRRGRVLMRRDAMYHLPRALEVEQRRLLGVFVHMITTRRITFRVFKAAIRAGRAPAGYRWVDPRHLERLPHSSYVAKAIALAQLK